MYHSYTPVPVRRPHPPDDCSLRFVSRSKSHKRARTAWRHPVRRDPRADGAHSIAALCVQPGHRSEGSRPLERLAGYLVEAQAALAFYADFTQRRRQIHSDFTQPRQRLRTLAERFRRGRSRCIPSLACFIGAARRVRQRFVMLARTRCRRCDTSHPSRHVRTSRGVTDMPAWLSLLCGVAVLVAAAYLLYVVLRPEDF
ncbi:F subunit of K+-transporting ATPase [Xanthomonas vasicola]